MFASMAYMHLQESPDAYGIASGELECVMPRTVPDRCVMALVLVLSGLCVCVCTVRRGLLTAKWRSGMLPSIRYVNISKDPNEYQFPPPSFWQVCVGEC